VAAPPRLPPHGVDQAPYQVRPNVLKLDPANPSSLPDDGDACGLHRVRAGQASQESRHQNPRIAPIIARRPRASRSADQRSPGSNTERAPRQPGLTRATLDEAGTRHSAAGTPLGRPKQARRGPRLGRSHLGEGECGSTATFPRRSRECRPDHRPASGEERGSRMGSRHSSSFLLRRAPRAVAARAPACGLRSRRSLPGSMSWFAPGFGARPPVLDRPVWRAARGPAVDQPGLCASTPGVHGAAPGTCRVPAVTLRLRP
jgi:hypothetical protein